MRYILLFGLLVFSSLGCSDEDNLEPYVGQSCLNYEVEACPEGLKCMSTTFGLCSGDYQGTCERVPSSCDGVAYEPVCDCSGRKYDNVCELRKKGGHLGIAPCP